ncbi:hypothetical protein [Microbacterium sp. cf332]|uniref:hypothetical protein n=1 Tax=Microbacterium sp. cf332 TaxID=1761804 RepID=UPI00088DBA25|nr:hypothetical protein [Microbacterium sp. cf332]SDQ46943.1 hypothetical protein SAMN04487847_1530 [Microbacterium sp. cf332]
MTAGPAARFAASRRTWEPIDWWRLEARAWQEAPAVRRVIAVFAPTSVFRELAVHSGRNPAVTVLLLVWNLVGLGAPVVGAALLLGWVFGRADVAAVGAAGFAFAAGAVVAGAGLVTTGRDAGRVDAGSAHAIGWVHVLAAGAALIAAILAVVQNEAEGAGGVAFIAADLVVGALYFVIFRRKPTDGSERWKRTVDRLAAAVSALDEDTRARILADLGDAIDELETAGRIPESLAADARQTPPGMLGARFAPRGA